MAIELGEKTKVKVGDGVKTYAELSYIESNADLTQYYTKTEVDDKIVEAVTKTFVLKGTVDDKASLPKTDNKVGDVYLVVDGDQHAEYVWTGTEWEYIGETFTVDLSGYYTKTEVDNIAKTKSDTGHTHTAADVTDLHKIATSGAYSDLTGTPTIDTELSATSTNAVQNKVINTALAGKAAASHKHAAGTDITGLATVATTGKYSDLTEKLNIDSALNQNSSNPITNGAVTKALAGKSDTDHTHTATQVTGLHKVATSGSYTDLADTPTIDTAMSETSTNAVQNKIVKAAIDAVATTAAGKADAKHTHTADDVTGLATVATSGKYSDLDGTPTIDTTLSSTSTNAVQNKVVNAKFTSMTTAINGKADASHTHAIADVTNLQDILDKCIKTDDTITINCTLS